MSLFALIAFVVLPILGGFIAWAGDVIGYRLGKSRRSLLGLRPRTTARVVGIAVGVLLPLITLVIASLGSSYVRIALFQLAALQASREQLLTDNERLTEENLGLQAQRQAAEQAAEAAQRQAQQAAAELLATQERLAAATASLQEAGRRLATVQQERNRLSAEREELRTQVEELVAARNLLQVELVETRHSRDEALAARQAADRDLEARTRELAAVEEQLAEVSASYEQIRAEEERLRLLEIPQLQAQMSRARDDLDRARRNLEAVQQELEAKEAQVAQQEQLLAGYARVLQAAAGRVRFEPGTELIRGQIDTSQTTAQIESSLRELLVLASRAAAAQGAGLAETGRAVVAVAPHPPEVSRFPPPEELVVWMVAREISLMRAPTAVVAARVVLRSFMDDGLPVAVELWSRPNELVYRRGHVIVQQEVDGSRPRAEVFQQVMGLLTALRTAALQSGLLRDLDTGQYGQVPAEQILETLDILVATGEKLRVEAVADQDVYVAMEKPFVVRLRVPEASDIPAPAGEPSE